MIVKDYKNGKHITLSSAFDNRSKYLNLIYFFVFSWAAILFIRMVLMDELDQTGLLFIIAVGGLYFFIGYKFLDKAFQSEYIIANKDTITIIKRGFLHSENATYLNSKISKFSHLDKPEVSKHPLAGETFDYLGFQTEQQVINELHGDHRLGFFYEGKLITFGENLYSWDFEQLELLLFDITGNDFRYDDEFEKSFITDETGS